MKNVAELDINNGGHTLPQNLTKHLIRQGIAKKVPPSLFICQLYYESNWGNSKVAKDNNNWGGLTWSGNPKRPSGIIVTRGTSRPSNEGGYYMKFNSVDDYLTDYVYLLTGQGIYNIQNKSSFELSVKGLFKEGGAKFNYAIVSWSQYVNTMVGIRNGINSRNNNILNKIDKNPNDYVDGEAPDPDPDPDPEPEPDGEMFFPVKITGGINFWTQPYANGSIQHGMDFGGPRSGRKHAGYDIGGGGVNHNIYAIRSGTVTFAGSKGNDRGLYIIIKHSSDNKYTLYQHLQFGTNKVKTGDKVKAGQHIAQMGNSPGGYSIHLHLELNSTGVFNGWGTTENPRTYLKVTGNNKTDLPQPK